MFDIQINGFFGLIWLIVVIWAVIRIAQSDASALGKALWIVAVILFPILGLIIWLLFGPK